MNRKIFSMIGLLSMMAVMPACEKSYNVENNNVNNQTKLKHEEVATNNNKATTNETPKQIPAAATTKAAPINNFNQTFLTLLTTNN